MIDFSQVIDLLLGNTPVEQVSDSRGNVLWSSAPVVLPNYFYVEDISGSDNTLSIVKESSSIPTTEIFKSTDRSNWTSMGSTDTTAITATVPANGKLYLKAVTSTLGNNYYNGTKISCTGNYNVGGYLTSLIFGDDFETNTLTGKSEYTFYNLFRNSVNLISAGKLIMPTTSLRRSYGSMFNGCTHLTTAPSLSQTAVNYSCFAEMFNGCTSLTTAPSLPATQLDYYCYQGMFKGCTSLATAPALPATTLTSHCYTDMFNGCTSLTAAPELPATTLANYCYNQMFSGCSNLNSVTTFATDITATSCLSNWLNGVASQGNFYNMACTTYESGANGIPSGWTEHHTTANTINVTITNTNSYSGATYQIDSGTAQPINETDTTSFTVPATATNLTVNRNGKGTTDILGVCGISSDSEWTTVLPVNKMSDNVNIDLVNLM